MYVPTVAGQHGAGVLVGVVVAALLLLPLGAGCLQGAVTQVRQVPVRRAEVGVGRVPALVLCRTRCTTVTHASHILSYTLHNGNTRVTHTVVHAAQR